MDRVRIVKLQAKVWKKRNFEGYAITLPKDFILKLGWRRGEELAVILDDEYGRLIVIPASRLRG